MQEIDGITPSTPQFLQESHNLRKFLKKYSQKELQEIFSLSESKAQEVYRAFQERLRSGIALVSFQGQSFKSLRIDQYSQEDLKFVQDHLYILSALYGVLKPFDLIKPYRLDMNDHIFQGDDTYKNLYEFWKNNIEEVFGDELIINLASGEYSKMVPKNTQKNMVTIDFQVNKDGGFKKAHSVLVKQMRGKVLHYMIKKQINKLGDIKKFNEEGFKFSKSMSTKNRITFLKRA